MKNIILILVTLTLFVQANVVPPCGKLDIRRRYIVAPICEPQPIKPIAPITIH